MNKRTINGKLLIAFLSVGMVFTACKKDDDDSSTGGTTPPPAPSVDNPMPKFSGATGAFAAVVVEGETPGPIPVPIQTASAAGGFFSGSTYKDGGNVTVSGKSLTKQSNNSYVWIQGTSANPWTSVSSSAMWDITGNTANGIAAKNFTLANFPTISKVTSSATISKTSAYTVSLQVGVTGADSILVVLSAGTASVTKVFPGTQSNNFVLTPTDLNKAGLSGSGVLQVAPYRYDFDANGQELVFYVNEKVTIKNVTVQ